MILLKMDMHLFMQVKIRYDREGIFLYLRLDTINNITGKGERYGENGMVS